MLSPTEKLPESFASVLSEFGQANTIHELIPSANVFRVDKLLLPKLHSAKLSEEWTLSLSMNAAFGASKMVNR